MGEHDEFAEARTHLAKYVLDRQVSSAVSVTSLRRSAGTEAVLSAGSSSQLKLAMFVGDNRHYRLDKIQGRHFIQTTERAGLPASLASEVLAEVAQTADASMTALEEQLPRGFPESIHEAVKAGVAKRLKHL